MYVFLKTQGRHGESCKLHIAVISETNATSETALLPIALMLQKCDLQAPHPSFLLKGLALFVGLAVHPHTNIVLNINSCTEFHLPQLLSTKHVFGIANIKSEEKFNFSSSHWQFSPASTCISASSSSLLHCISAFVLFLYFGLAFRSQEVS